MADVMLSTSWKTSELRKTKTDHASGPLAIAKPARRLAVARAVLGAATRTAKAQAVDEP